MRQTEIAFVVMRCGKGKGMREKKIVKWRWIKILLTVGLVVFCLGIWPGYLIHTYQMVDLYPSNVSQTQWLSTGDVVKQYFVPVKSRISKIEMALEFDKSVVSDEYLDFTILNDAGTSICSKEIFFSQINESHFFDIVVKEKFDPGHEYVWTLTMSEPTGLQYAVLCADDINGYVTENKALLINEEDTHGGAVNMYEYYEHYDKVVIIGGFWTGAILVWLLLLEFTDRAERFLERKKNDREDKCSKEI